MGFVQLVRGRNGNGVRITSITENLIRMDLTLTCPKIDTHVCVSGWFLVYFINWGHAEIHPLAYTHAHRDDDV